MKTGTVMLGRTWENYVEVLGEKNPDQLYVRCPGAGLHNTPTGPHDTLLFIKGAPTAHCVHQSCTGPVADLNATLRRAFPSDNPNPRRVESGPVINRAAIQAARKEALAEQGKKASAQIMVKYPWPRCDIWEASPVRCDDLNPLQEARLFIRSAFPDDCLFWIGEPANSNEAGAIRASGEWLHDDSIINRPSICPNGFTSREAGRRKENVASVRYVVLEADGLSDDAENNQDLSGALIRWAREAVGLNLFAVVSSGNKSLHAWFAVDESLREFLSSQDAAALLASLGFDSAAVRAAQAFRFPGHMRRDTGRLQSLLYLDPAAGAIRSGATTAQQVPV